MIRLEGVAAAPRGARRAILGPLDLTIEAGERHLVLGANGAGKTTLLRLLAGLLAPLEGRVRWGDVETGPGAAPPSLWPRVAALFETPDPQFLAETVRSEISFGLESLGLASGAIDARIEDALDAFRLREFAERDPRTLSAGEKARALLAAAHAARPSCLLLDQTLAHLDPGSRRALETRLAREAAEGSFALVRAHQEAEPPFAGERLHVLDGGRLREANAFSSRELHEARHLPLPPALRLTAAMAARGFWDGPPVADVGEVARRLASRAGDTGARREETPGAGWGRRGRAPGSPESADPPGRHAPSGCAFAAQALVWAPGAGPVLFDGFDLEGARGEIVALVGRSGSGKSSLLRLIAGLESPRGGVAWRATPKGGGRGCAMAMEYPERQLIGRSVLEDVGLALWTDGVPRVERERLALRALAAVGLLPGRFAKRLPSTLSEGEKRRVAIAGLLAEPAPLLLLDEPTAGLDPEGRRALRATLEALRARERTVLLASHDLDFVHAVADRVVLLARAEGGPARIVRDGAPASVFRDEGALLDAGIPAPDVVVLQDALHAAGLALRSGAEAPSAGEEGEWEFERDSGSVARASRAVDVGAGAA